MLNQRRAGAVLSYISLLINALISFVYVPLLLGFLSTSEYGVYEMIGSIIAYLSVMDMGLCTTLNRYYVNIRETEGEKDVENLLAIAAIIYAFLTVVAVAIGIAIYFSIDTVFSGGFSVAELDLARKMMLLVIINVIIVLPGNWFLAIINANERFVFARGLSIIKYVLQIATVLAVLMWRSSALAVLVVQVAYNALAIIAYALYCFAKLRVKSHLYHWDWRLVGSLCAFSFFILLNMAFDQIFWKTGQVVLGAVIGTTAVAVYGIACKVVTAYMQLSTGISSVFLPKLTAISADSDDMTEINALFDKIGRLQFIIVGAVFFAFVIMGKEFVVLWAGASFSEVYPLVVILMLSLVIALTQNLGISILQAKNKMGFRSVVYIGLAILDVLISIPMSARYGTLGCAIVAAVLLFIGTGPIMNIFYRVKIGIDIKSFYRKTLPLLIPMSVTTAIVYLVTMFLMPAFSWTHFVIEFILFCVIYFLALLPFFDEYEKGLLADFRRRFQRTR